MARVGIAIVTYERRSLLERLVGALRELTGDPYELVVADDGSRDGSVEWCRSRGLRVVSGTNRGVAWNKNRGLFALAQLGCDPLLLIEDDAYPVVRGWERDWIEATRRWHHLAYHHAKAALHTVSGSGTPADPFVSPAASAVCLSVSAEVLERVGFFDSRFRGWGHEHAEWTTRIKRAGYGYKEITLPDGRRPKAQLYLTGGLAGGKGTSFRNEDQARVNRELQLRIAAEPLFRCPWRSDGERNELLAEQTAAGIDGSELARLLDARRARVNGGASGPPGES
ncbi:MAG TPA: glycosyltransferase [Solirubrobacteraceae bacterium]|jgi:glycosyltransferase involved in cell wall biosynthesis|nr:glycosyltransferase [Solirubrobacteraceae bacterium]